MVVEIALAVLAGLLIGSFLNVCIFRLPRDLSVASPARSFCPECEKTIAWYDNIPVLSFLLLKGRCRNCGSKIPLRYPVVELLTGISFGVCVAEYGVTLEMVKYAVFCAAMIDLVATDFEERILPDEFTLGGTLVGLIFAYFVPITPEFSTFLTPSLIGTPWLSVEEAAIGAAVVSGLIFAMGWLYQKVRGREGLGLGDVKMIMMMGAFFGLKLVLLTVIVGSLLGTIGGVGFILLARKDAATYELPFGSFLGIAALGVALLGTMLPR